MRPAPSRAAHHVRRASPSRWVDSDTGLPAGPAVAIAVTISLCICIPALVLGLGWHA